MNGTTAAVAAARWVIDMVGPRAASTNEIPPQTIAKAAIASSQPRCDRAAPGNTRATRPPTPADTHM